MTVPPDELIYGPTEPEDKLTAGESALLGRLRSADNWDDWVLFVNVGFKLADAKGLTERGLTEMSEQLGMPAIRFVRGGRAMSENDLVAIRIRHARTNGFLTLSPAEVDRGVLLDEIDRLLATNQALEAMVAGLFDAIKHGDAEHQAWLKDKIAAHFASSEAARRMVAVVEAASGVADYPHIHQGPGWHLEIDKLREALTAYRSTR